MKKLYPSILFFYLMVLATAHAQWVNVSFNDNRIQANFRHIRFLNKKIGVVAENFGARNYVGKYSYYTINGIRDWKRVDLFPDLSPMSPIIQFAPKFWISVVGNKQNNSLDSGKTWSLNSNNESIYISKSNVLNQQDCFILNSGGNNVIKTNDGGRSWKTCPALTNNFTIDTYLDLSFPTTSIGYVVGINSSLTKTINGGDTWFNLAFPFGSFQFNGVDFISETEGIVVGEAGKIFKTTDGGKIWKDYSIKGSSPTLTAIDYVTPTIAYTCGYGGVIYQTTNGGKDWQLMESGTNNDLLAISFVDSTLGHCSGARSTILKLDNSPIPKVTKVQANKSGYCEGDSATVSYVVNKKFDASNFFVLQLSDGLGRFNQATELLRWNGDTSGIVKIKLPTGLITDQNYRFRIYSTETELPSVANDSSIQINRTDVATVGVELLPSNKLCDGEGATFTAKPQYGGDKPTYKWFINDKQVATTISYSYKPTNLDKIYVVLTSNSSCVSTSVATSQTTIMAVNPIPARPTISKEGMKLVSSASLGNQWFANGSVLKDSTKQSITAKVQSLYSVKVTLNGCTSPMSALFDLILATEEEQGSMQSLTIYPNPTNNNLSIRSNLNITKLVVYQSNSTKVLESKATENLDVSALLEGLYLLEAWDMEGRRVVKKFEKR